MQIAPTLSFSLPRLPLTVTPRDLRAAESLDSFAASAPGPSLTPAKPRPDALAGYLKQMAASTVPQAALTPAGGAALALAAQKLDGFEMVTGNCGYYHNVQHPLNVAGAAGEIAQKLGYGKGEQTLIQEVALLHDFDPRLDLKSGSEQPKPGTPARVQVTLDWMNQNKPAIQQRFGWDDLKFNVAQAMIARTDFPLDGTPRSYGTRYDGQSPIDVYRNALQQLPLEARGPAMEYGIILSYADQVGNYLGTPAQSEASVRGLALEIGADPDMLLAGSAQFQRSVGADSSVDRALAQGLQVWPERFPSAADMQSALSEQSRHNLEATRARFAELERPR